MSRSALSILSRSSLLSGRLAGEGESPGESRVGLANVLGADRDRVAIRIAVACGARRRKELSGGCRRFSGGEGKLVTRVTRPPGRPARPARDRRRTRKLEEGSRSIYRGSVLAAVAG